MKLITKKIRGNYFTEMSKIQSLINLRLMNESFRKLFPGKRTKAFEKKIYARRIDKGFSFPKTAISSLSLFEFPVCFIFQRVFLQKEILM